MTKRATAVILGGLMIMGTSQMISCSLQAKTTTQPTTQPATTHVTTPKTVRVALETTQGTIVLYEWDFDGDGTYDWSSTTTALISHTYTSVGAYNATIKVTYSTGATATDTITITTDPVIPAFIDIKPGSYPNSIKLDSHGLIPVAILSSEEFDATNVDPETVELAGAGITVRGKSNKFMAHEEDVNGDGLLDLVVQVETENLDPGLFQDGIVILTGETYDGQCIEGIDEITIVPPEE